MKPIQTAAIALLAMVGLGGCQSAPTREVEARRPFSVAVDGICGGLGERIDYGSFHHHSPPEQTFVRRIYSRGEGGYCYTTPQTIAADLRAQDAAR